MVEKRYNLMKRHQTKFNKKNLIKVSENKLPKL